ncbi:MAG: sulfatase [Rhodopirellula sp.]|nr:sulfatase [Rhodopirellula sp.]
MIFRTLATAVLAATAWAPTDAAERAVPSPNVVFVFADQWRADAVGYAADPNVKTPNLDRMADEAMTFTHAVSGCPVCSPYRGTLLTGQRPLTHGVFVNDVQLPDKAVTIAEVLAGCGYRTAYIGKWHLDGHGRSSYIPPLRRQGFEYFRVLECTHNYNRSAYYEGGDSTKKWWQGYDASAQTDDAVSYIQRQSRETAPFLLMLSWGPPHNPYETAPEPYRAMYRPEEIKLRPNVPAAEADLARRELAGYYAHCSVLDACLARIRQALCDGAIERDTIFVFTSDHGDMLHSHGEIRKQKPWDESIRVPLLIRYPRLLGESGRRLDVPINSEDLMPTLLGLAGVAIPASVEGQDFSGYLRGGQAPSDGAALLTCPWPFGEWQRLRGGREYRGIRTRRYTYARTLAGPWLLFDNQADPYQLDNLIDKPQHAQLQSQLESVLQRKLQEAGDQFLRGEAYIEKWAYQVDASGTVPYAP